MKPIQIFLENSNNPCYPGDKLAGRVECLFNKEETLKAVRIKFDGRAEIEWHVSHGNDRSRTRYHAEEVYFHTEYNLIQVADSGCEELRTTSCFGENLRLPPGKYTYAFSYTLPQRLPSSFDGTYGNIRYYIKAIVDRPWKFDYEDKVDLKVISPLNLNYLPGLRSPVATSADKTIFSLWCNDSRVLTFNIALPASGFVPDQDVNIRVDVENMTNINVENMKFKIVGEIEYISRHPSRQTKYEKTMVMECIEDGVVAHGEKSRISTLTIPTDQDYPNLISCNIINIRYFLKAKVSLPFPHTNLKNVIPITIGTVPLSDVTNFLMCPRPLPFALPSNISCFEDAPPPPYPWDDTPCPFPNAKPSLSGTKLGDSRILQPLNLLVGLSPPTYEESQQLKMKNEMPG